jgi:DNA-binding NtrC family response regulator
MSEKISVLLVSGEPESFAPLKSLLQSQSLETREVPSCGEALLVLWGKQPPHLVFTDTQLPDGTWAEVISLAGKAQAPSNVIVVSRLVDVKLYVEAIERGAFDFITPPFEARELRHIVRRATEDVLERRAIARRNRENSATTPDKESTRPPQGLMAALDPAAT